MAGGAALVGRVFGCSAAVLTVGSAVLFRRGDGVGGYRSAKDAPAAGSGNRSGATSVRGRSGR
jgi:hypothetical protein